MFRSRSATTTWISMILTRKHDRREVMRRDHVIVHRQVGERVIFLLPLRRNRLLLSERIGSVPLS